MLEIIAFTHNRLFFTLSLLLFLFHCFHLVFLRCTYILALNLILTGCDLVSTRLFITGCSKSVPYRKEDILG